MSHLIAEALSSSAALHCIVATAEGVVTACNPPVAAALQTSCDQLVGTLLWQKLTESDAASLQKRMRGSHGSAEPVLLTFTTPADDPYVLSGWLEVHPTYFAILGAVPAKEEALADDALYALNNDLAVLARENARAGKELAFAKGQLQTAIDELNNSYWHLRKVAEVLPMCAECGKVNPNEGEWQTVVDYLRQHSLFLSHGCCPDCLGRMRADLGLVHKDAE